jgi:hypothetical protein
MAYDNYFAARRRFFRLRKKFPKYFAKSSQIKTPVQKAGLAEGTRDEG